MKDRLIFNETSDRNNDDLAVSDDPIIKAVLFGKQKYDAFDKIVTVFDNHQK